MTDIERHDFDLNVVLPRRSLEDIVRLGFVIGSLAFAAMICASPSPAKAAGEAQEFAATTPLSYNKIPVATTPVIHAAIIHVAHVSPSIPAISAPIGDNPNTSPCCTVIAPSPPPLIVPPPPVIVGSGPIAPITLQASCCTAEPVAPIVLPPCCQAKPHEVELQEPPHDHLHPIEEPEAPKVQIAVAAMPIPVFTDAELRLPAGESVKPIHFEAAPLNPIDIIALALLGAAIAASRRRRSSFDPVCPHAQSDHDSNVSNIAEFRAKRQRQPFRYDEAPGFEQERRAA